MNKSKRKSLKRKGRTASKRSVRSTLGTTWRWMGNSKERFNFSTRRNRAAYYE